MIIMEMIIVVVIIIIVRCSDLYEDMGQQEKPEDLPKQEHAASEEADSRHGV